MGYHPRIETSEYSCLLTTRSRNSELWFVNNQTLENAILGYAAKYSTHYSVKLYALAIEGNHIQGVAHFPNMNRAAFMRDLNSTTAKAVARYTPEYPGGRFWGRRYSSEFLPRNEDIERYFFYTVLQAVQDGLVDKISDYPGYNCFHDAAWGIKRKFKVIEWARYNSSRRRNKNIKLSNFTKIVELKYERLPGYEHLSQKEYANMLTAKLEHYRNLIIQERNKKDKGFTGREKLLKAKRGAKPKNTKTSTINCFRPRVLCSCPITRQQALNWYFAIYERFKRCSEKYRNGELLTEFPPGTYKPFLSSFA